MKKRETNRWIKERKDKKGRLLCLVPTCNNLRQKYKTSGRTRNYCKDHNCWDMREFTNWQCLREKVLKRDNYTCVKCGDNKKEVKVNFVSKYPQNIKEVVDGHARGEKVKIIYKETIYPQIKSNLVADHIIPIALGGDEWDMENIQTLCLKCDKEKTKEDMKQIVALRKRERIKTKELE